MAIDGIGSLRTILFVVVVYFFAIGFMVGPTHFGCDTLLSTLDGNILMCFLFGLYGLLHLDLFNADFGFLFF